MLLSLLTVSLHFQSCTHTHNIPHSYEHPRVAGKGGRGPWPWAQGPSLVPSEHSILASCRPRSSGPGPWDPKQGPAGKRWKTGYYCLTYFIVLAPGEGLEGHTLASFQGNVSREEAGFALHVTVLRPEVRIPGYFNRKIHAFMLVKGWLAFALSACAEGPGAISPRPGTAAGVCSLPPHLVP